MKHFITGLQFLTRIYVAKQTEWSPESFGRSVKFFPLIGGILGILLVMINQLFAEYLPFFGVYMPPHVLAILLLIANVVLTGGLHCDGFMDTMDGLFSGRSKERMLEIMKDSRVGANGVMAFVLLVLLKWSLITEMSPLLLPSSLFVMPILGRFAMLVGITVFPYARPDGIGKAFAQYADKYTLYIGIALTLLLIIPIGKQAILCLGIVSLCTMLFARYATKLVGGLTGDIYGALSELGEIIVLFVFLF
ncbi:adenosylcobinamide-GDP ribazoletransferase [Pelosinus sp. sgz500959]|uniref:adenosylcobinamide-GDP ribazoletransferase n=1 Tax=Pelosinus sp. sgz500959 TaxID=3242472 RepID=UPI00366E3326